MKYTIHDLLYDYPNESACLIWLFEHVYPTKLVCEGCNEETKYYLLKNRKVFRCGKCSHQISPMVGTIFENSHISLRNWFYAIYLMATNKAGTSAKQIERQLGVTYKTAWRMMHQIRSIMDTPEGLLHGEVEIDETFVHANSFKRSSARKRYGLDARRTGQVVFGAVQRGGAVKVWHVNGANVTTIMPLIKKHIAEGTIIHSDGFTMYRRLPGMGYEHRWTDHGKGQYYTENSYTQNIENVWSHFKRGIKGVYRHIGKPYIQAYANEYAWRYSNRNKPSMFWSLMNLVHKETLQ